MDDKELLERADSTEYQDAGVHAAGAKVPRNKAIAAARAKAKADRDATWAAAWYATFGRW